MGLDLPAVMVIVLFAAWTMLGFFKKPLHVSSRIEAYYHYVWALFLFFSVKELAGFEIAIWILALVCFVGLREYFSLLEIRLEDRWGIWGAYLSIPFMIYFIQIDWYGMFIVSIPVYAFLIIPFLVALGSKKAEGTLLSIGAIDFGLFLLVFCLGHIGYLTRYSTWMSIMLLLNVVICDLVAVGLEYRARPPWTNNALRYLVSLPLTILLTVALTRWTAIPLPHSLTLGALIPVLVAIGRFTIRRIESDLGIEREHLIPGRGRMLNSGAASLYAAPIVFHYIRYFLS